MKEVKRLVKSLPSDLRAAAEKLPVAFEAFPSEALQEEGIEPDTLGLFVGPTHAEDAGAWAGPPAQIILYLQNLWDYAEQDRESFLREVRVTYLHELGHYLGLDEGELLDRELD